MENDKDTQKSIPKELYEDEIYSTWYECSLCGGTLIAQTFKYCPDCGAEIQWPSEGSDA